MNDTYKENISQQPCLVVLSKLGEFVTHTTFVTLGGSIPFKFILRTYISMLCRIQSAIQIYTPHIYLHTLQDSER